MAKFLLLAFRNVFRNRRRTLMTLIIVGGGVAGLLLVGGFFESMFVGIRESTISGGLGHLQVFTAEHFRRDEIRIMDTGIDNWKQVAGSISSAPHVRGVAPRIDFFGLVSNGSKSSMFMGSAVDPDAEKSLGFPARIFTGRDLSGQANGEVEALIGADLAKSMNVKVGDGLTLLTTTSDGAINGIDVQIVGIVKTGWAEVDARYLRITLASAQRLLATDRVTNLVVGLDKTENTDAVYDELKPRLQGQSQELALRKWVDLATSYKQIRGLFMTIFYFIGVIVFFMVLMSSVNTLLMTMFERTREIGTMLAMGTPRRWIEALFMLEATLLGTTGAVVGVVGGLLLGVFLNHSGIHLPPPPGTTVPMTFRVMIGASLMIGSSLLVIVSLVLASIVPAIRASRLQIAEALAHV